VLRSFCQDCPSVHNNFSEPILRKSERLNLCSELRSVDSHTQH